MAGYVLHLSTEENITLSPAAVRRLIGGGNGDAALLYLAILQAHGAADSTKLARELKWDEERLRAAEQALYEMKLVGAPEKREEPSLPSPLQQTNEPPEYTREDIMRKLERDGRFACLLHEVEHKLGPLSIPSVKKLLGLYENLGLPADVVYTLVNYCIEKKAQQFGEGRLPNMREIERGLRLGAQGAFFHRKGQRVHAARAEPAGQIPRVHGGTAHGRPRERAERGKVSLRLGGDGLSGRNGVGGLRPDGAALPRVPLALLQRHLEALARKGPAHA